MSAMSDLDVMKDEVFAALDELRESGKINMYGAAPYVAEWFGVDKIQARYLLGEWRRTFSERHARKSRPGGERLPNSTFL